MCNILRSLLSDAKECPISVMLWKDPRRSTRVISSATFSPPVEQFDISLDT